jgi:hypothetical protein
MLTNRTYRVTLYLSEPEAIALARLAHSEFRQMRTQAHHIVYTNLINLGLLSELQIESDTPPRGAITKP